MNSYKILKNLKFSSGRYAIVPIRSEDRYDIMNWRNEQMYHLRQSAPLTKEKQDNYFDSVISKLFEQDKPEQILFSYIEGEKCIGYGGLVHINWLDKNAEVSFIMDTSLEKNKFEYHWTIFLDLLEALAFKEFKLHKIFVYAFDLRPHLYLVLTKNKFFKDAVLKQHCLFDNKYLDVLIYSKIE